MCVYFYLSDLDHLTFLKKQWNTHIVVKCQNTTFCAVKLNSFFLYVKVDSRVHWYLLRHKCLMSDVSTKHLLKFVSAFIALLPYILIGKFPFCFIFYFQYCDCFFFSKPKDQELKSCLLVII